MEEQQSASRTRTQTARAVVLAGAAVMFLFAAAVLLSGNSGPGALEVSAEDLVSALPMAFVIRQVQLLPKVGSSMRVARSDVSS